MTESEAHEVVGILGDAYRMSQRRLEWYARALMRFPAGPVAQVLERLVESEKAPPTIAVITNAVTQRLESMGAASPTFAPRGERMERLLVWRSVLEDSTSPPRERHDAHDRIAWMDPPVTPSEWRDARAVAEARHAARNQQLLGEGKPPRPARPPLSWPAPPAPDPQPLLSRDACKAGMRALWGGIERRLPSEAMVAHVLSAVRSAEAAARARVAAATVPPGDDW